MRPPWIVPWVVRVVSGKKVGVVTRVGRKSRTIHRVKTATPVWAAGRTDERAACDVSAPYASHGHPTTAASLSPQGMTSKALNAAMNIQRRIRAFSLRERERVSEISKSPGLVLYPDPTVHVFFRLILLFRARYS